MSKKKKGKMARRLVYYCIGVLTITGLWAVVLYTLALFRDVTIDLSAPLTFVGTAFGAELLMCLVKRIFAKEVETDE